MSSRTRFSHLRYLAFLAGISALLIPELHSEDQRSIIPPGKPEIGLGLFVGKGCHQCHSAGSTKLPPVDLAPRLVIELAGDIHEAWTRDDFARAIINPNHAVAEDYRVAMMRVGDNFKAENSQMPDFTEMLSISDLINLTTFLEDLTEQPPNP